MRFIPKRIKSVPWRLVAIAAILILSNVATYFLNGKLQWLHANIAYQTNLPMPDWFQYEVDSHLQIDHADQGSSVVLLGDSIVRSLPASSLSMPTLNFGISGDTTVGVLQRIPRYESIRRARAIVLSIGVNDLGKASNERIVGRWQMILDSLPADVPIVFCSILPIDERVFTIRDNARIRSLNEQAKRELRPRQPLIFLDVRDRLTDSTGNLRPDFNRGDGIHLIDAGYAVWAGAIDDALHNPALQRSPATALSND